MNFTVAPGQTYLPRLFHFENVQIKIWLLIGQCEQEMLLIWKIEDQDLFQHGSMAGKGSWAKLCCKRYYRELFCLFTSHQNRACRNILFMYIIKNKFPGRFLASFLVNIIIIIIIEFWFEHFHNECIIWDDKWIQISNNQLINIVYGGTLDLAQL